MRRFSQVIEWLENLQNTLLSVNIYNMDIDQKDRLDDRLEAVREAIRIIKEREEQK